jgi:hypothetical protein
MYAVKAMSLKPYIIVTDKKLNDKNKTSLFSVGLCNIECSLCIGVLYDTSLSLSPCH